MLAYRSRSEKEVVSDLERKGFQHKLVGEVIEQLHGEGYLDDDRFAMQLIESCQEANKGWTRIYTELRKRGIKRDRAEESLNAHYDERKAEETLEYLVRESMGNLPAPPGKVDFASIIRKISRMGFPPSSIMNAMHLACREMEHCEQSDFLDSG
ncbi:MAG: RecX family transcriptional regulator [Actinomycetota bacterium]|nr:RecX family transcriptional regulator [Actinomycetota bacterium]